MYNIIYSDTLSHHGILGMKWGKRNGPPYPLDAEDHSASERKAGWRKSLQKTASKRKPGYFGTIKKVIDAEKNRDAQKSQFKKNADSLKSEINSLRSSGKLSAISELGDRFNTIGNELGEDYDNYYKKVVKDPAFRNAVWNELYKDFGTGVDDEDLFDTIKEEIVDELVEKRTPSSLRNKTQDFFRIGDQYFDELRAVSKDILDKYKDKPINNAGGKVDQNYLYKILDDRSAWNSYMYRHFDDYWVNDVESRYDISNSFTADEYNRKFAHGK